MYGTMHACSKLCFSYSSHATPPGAFQWNLTETFILCLLKAGSRPEMEQLELDSEAIVSTGTVLVTSSRCVKILY